jgi:hypothetical protein
MIIQIKRCCLHLYERTRARLVRAIFRQNSTDGFNYNYIGIKFTNVQTKYDISKESGLKFVNQII